MCVVCVFAEPKVKAKVRAIVDEYTGRWMDNEVMQEVGTRIGAAIEGSHYIHGKARLRFADGILIVEFHPLPPQTRNWLN